MAGAGIGDQRVAIGGEDDRAAADIVGPEPRGETRRHAELCAGGPAHAMAELPTLGLAKGAGRLAASIRMRVPGGGLRASCAYAAVQKSAMSRVTIPRIALSRCGERGTVARRAMGR